MKSLIPCSGLPDRPLQSTHSIIMLFQKEMRLLIDNEVMPQEDSAEVDVSELMEKLLKTRKQAFADVDANIKSAQKKQKETYDRKHQPAIFAVGTEVLLENTKQKQRKGGKLENLWLGPYIVHQHVGKGVYQLRNMAGEVLTKKVNINRLKKYTRREQEVHESRKKTEEESSDEERNKEVVEGEDMEGLSTIGVKKRKCLATSPKKAKRQKYDVIDDANVEDLEKPWVTVGSVRLYEHEKTVLVNSNWLTDTLIHAAQLLMKNDTDLLSVGGFQNPLFASTPRFMQMDGEFVQILHSGSNHWITISTVGCASSRVRIYDSLLSSSLPFATKKVIAFLMNCKDSAITLEYASIQVC